MRGCSKWLSRPFAKPKCLPMSSNSGIPRSLWSRSDWGLCRDYVLTVVLILISTTDVWWGFEYSIQYHTVSILMYLGSTRLCHEVAIQTKTFHKADFSRETSRRNIKLKDQSVVYPGYTENSHVEWNITGSNQWIYQLSTIQQLTSRESQCASCTRGPDRTPKPWSIFWMDVLLLPNLLLDIIQQPLELLWQCCMMVVLLVQQDYYCSKKVLGQTIRLLWPTSALPPARLSPDAELATNAATSQGTTLPADVSFWKLYLECCNNSRSQKELQVMRIWTWDTLMIVKDSKESHVTQVNPMVFFGGSQNALGRDINKKYRNISVVQDSHMSIFQPLSQWSLRSITMIT